VLWIPEQAWIKRRYRNLSVKGEEKMATIVHKWVVVDEPVVALDYQQVSLNDA